MNARINEVIRQIDELNSEDPNVESFEGAQFPKELLYGRRMTSWLDKLYPEASDLLRIAVRAQHIRRWAIPRADYPIDRRGYLRWRTELKNYHAETTAAILRENGYDEAEIATISSLLRKEGLRDNAETQFLEDVACLVFLENYFADFASQHDPGKVVDIVRKTWGKMSERAHQAALTLNFAPEALALVQRALSPDK